MSAALAAILAAVLALAVIRAMQSPRVRLGVAVLAGAGAAVVVADGYGLILLGAAGLAVSAVLAPVTFLLARFTVATSVRGTA